MKKYIGPLLGVLAGILLLDIFCAFYYNPTGYIVSDGATDLIREPDAFTSRATEGIAWMTMDENGYNNAFTPAEGEISVLMMGSSHTEALNVMPEDSVSEKLDALLRADGFEGHVYNIGMSSHTLVRNISNFANALDRFRPTDYVIVETADVIMYTSSLRDAMADTLEPLPAAGIDMPGLITDRPLLRALYRQYMNLTGEEYVELYADYIPEDTMGRYEEALTEAFAMLKAEADDHGVGLIIYYHPHMNLSDDGSHVTPATQAQCEEVFRRACEVNSITYLDMSGPFIEAYVKQHVLPHGFNNTVAGTGHLNPTGHSLIAGELHRIITEKEAAE